MNIVNFDHGDSSLLGMYVAFVVWTFDSRRAAARVPVVGAGAPPRLASSSIFGVDPEVVRTAVLAAELFSHFTSLERCCAIPCLRLWRNFMTLRKNIVGRKFESRASGLRHSRLLAGCIAMVVRRPASVASAPSSALEDDGGGRGSDIGPS